MRRVIVVVLFMVVVAVSYAQPNDPKPMPKTVRAFLDHLVGTWDMDGTTKGRVESQWDAGKSAIVTNVQFSEGTLLGSCSALWYWDGISDDGVIACWSVSTNQGFAQIRQEGKVLSETVFEGPRAGGWAGRELSARSRIEFAGPDRFTWTVTDIVVGGEEKPDFTDVYTRVKGVTPEAFEEFCKLSEGAWRGKTALDADIPGVGKKGETVTAHYHYTRAEAGAALIGKSYWPDGTHTWFLAYDKAHKRIRTLGVSSIYGLVAHDVQYSNRTWMAKGTRAGPDGTDTYFDLTGVFNESGNKLTVTGSRIRGGKKREFVDVWHRMSQ